MSVLKLFDMKKKGVTDTTIQDFKKGGIDFLENKTLRDIIKSNTTSLSEKELDDALNTFETVELEIGVEGSYSAIPEFSVRVRQPSTGREVYFSDFKLVNNAGQNALNFKASMPIPAQVLANIKRPDPSSKTNTVALSYLDLCYGGALELTATSTDTVTHLREGANYADIGWSLSSRYVDTLIDAIGKLNDTLFEDSLRESIIYIRN